MNDHKKNKRHLGRTLFYRYSPIENLLNNHELELHSLYVNNLKFHSNTSNFRSLIWEGEHKVWENLFRHYLYCILETKLCESLYHHDKKCFTIEAFPYDNVPTQEGFPAFESYKRFEDLYATIKKHLHLDEIINSLARKKQTQSSLEEYLQFIHLPIILMSYHFLHSPTGPSLDPNIIAASAKVAEIILNLSANEEGDKSIEEETLKQQLYERSRLIIEIISALTQRTIDPSLTLTLTQFPLLYIQKMAALTIHPTSTLFSASFYKNIHSLSLWDHFAAHHSGVALIFESRNHQLSIKNHHDHWYTSYTLQPITYRTSNERNFYTSLSGLSREKIEQWHQCQNGKRTDFGKYFQNNEERWRSDVGKDFYQDILTKSIISEKEEEHRLIIEHLNENYSTIFRQHYFYDPKQLKGIVFGIDTPSKHINHILHMIRNGHYDNDFKFYQAYFDQKNNIIQKRLMAL